MRNLSLLNHSLKLVIQPGDAETGQYLHSLGFQPIPKVPQLLYLGGDDAQFADIFARLSHELSEASQASSRFLLTQLPLASKQLLIEFLQAEPLSSITVSVKHRWFLHALAKRAFFFKYQPIFNLASGDVVGYECLARVLGLKGQPLSGKQIIDAALSTQAICEFDELARESCIHSIASLNSSQTFFINILPNAIIRTPESLEQNFQQVLELGLQPQQIVFELTEVQSLLHHPGLAEVIDRVREWGFGIAVDDLCGCVAVDHYFMKFHPDVIKLDRQLVHGCSRHSLQQVLIKSLLQSAHELGILVVAEGLEDVEDIAFCRDLGVDLGQGFGLAMPQLTLQDHPFDSFSFFSGAPRKRSPLPLTSPEVKITQMPQRRCRLIHAIS